eukprot:scaffold10417_cov137-Skeletonema_marinoi.AAC.36
MRNDDRDRLIVSCFETVSDLIRNSKPTDEEKAYVTDSFRLKLYGFYKCSSGGEQSSNYARPSFFDPVGRAKYDAWVECESLCGGDRVAAMKNYLELASSVTQTGVGRQCRDIYDDAIEQIEQIQPVSPTQKEKPGDAEEMSGTECHGAINEETTSTKNYHCNQMDELSKAKPAKSSFLTPLVPRGHLDITFRNLSYALLQCLKYILYASLFSGGFMHCILSYVMPSSLLKFLGTLCSTIHPQRHIDWFEKNIEKQWLEMEHNSKKEATDLKTTTPQVLVGLSERSLFDLFLSVHSFPAEAEIIIVPPVNIPGMVDVIRYHQLVMVSVDLPARKTKTIANSDEAKNEHSNSDETSKSTNAVWSIDTTAVRKAMSKKTIAIFVVHPFGAVLGKDSMAELRTMANENKLDIWEDCAQCYSGSGYTGSSFANASFFSFGPIKTATALGGGLAVLRSPCNKDDNGTTSHEQELERVSTLASTMRRIQETKHKQQPNNVYLWRVVKCIALHVISQSRYLCAAAKVIIERFGLDYNDFVVSSLRGFSPSTQDNNQVLRLRYRPCPAMLSLLLRRLRDCKSTERNVLEQTNRCSSFLKLLRSAKSVEQQITIPEGDDDLAMYGWLFPVLVERPQQLSNLLLEMGYDAPCGATQLKPVGDDCTLTKAFFDRVLYLPVTSQKFTTKDQQNLIKALSAALSTKNSHIDNRGAAKSNGGRTRYRELQQSLAMALLGWLYSLSGVDFRLRYIVKLTSTAFGVAILLVLALCRYMGSFYLESSRAFSKHCGMIFQSPFHEELTKETGQGNNSPYNSLMALEWTRVPNIIRATSSTAEEDKRMAILSGSTGFIGSLLLRNLLLNRKALSLDGGVVLLVRSKKGVSSHERVKRILSNSMFDFLSATDKESLVHVVEADVTLPNCGMESSLILSIRERNISHVFHCAAAVSFSQPLEEAALSNITSSLQMQLLTKSLRNGDAKFVHVSTAFVHGGETGTKDAPLPESLYSLDPYDPVEIYKSMLATQSYASAAMKDLRFPNTYTFSKCVCEHLLQREQHVDTIIIRPSIVGPAACEPFEGWSGERPSTVVAAACLYLKFPYIMWSFGKEKVPFIPVDVVCRYIISQSFQENCSDDTVDTDEEKKEARIPSTNENESNCLQIIKTVSWDVASPDSSSFSWISYAFAIVHLGAVCGHVNRVIAYAGLLVSAKIFPKLNLSLESFRRIHSILKVPINGFLDLCDRLPWKPKSAGNLKSLSPLFDLPLLFFPFSNQNFHFKSDLVAPDNFDGERYMFSCVVAAHRFIQKYEKRLKSHKSNLRKYANESFSSNVGPALNRHSCSLVIAGDKHSKPTSDLLWACTQPKGNLFIRFGGWLLAKLFRMTAAEIEIDIASFTSLARQISASNPDSVIIAPTHRSYYDFLIISYICFVLPELGIDIPHIAAASEFSNLPFLGWIAASMNAFFIKRDEKKRDLRLKEKLSCILSKKQKPSFLEVFVEGKRSRNRSFVKPKTGFLRCVSELGDNPHLVLPITINYEALPDQSSLISEASGNRRENMSLSKLCCWMYRVFCGEVNIGRVYISASKAFEMTPHDSNKVDKISQTILSRQQERIVVSGYHIRAASCALGVSESEVVDSLGHLNCTLWPSLDTRTLHPPINESSQDFLWSCLMHFGHVFAPFLESTHKAWVTILFPAGSQSHSATNNVKEVNTIVSKIAHKFDTAEEVVEKAVIRLRSKGFSTPMAEHIFQYAHSDEVPMSLIRIAVKMTVEKCSLNKSSSNAIASSRKVDSSQQQVNPLFSSQLNIGSRNRGSGDSVESFGSWGFEDSRFVLNTLPNGSNVVIMKGGRYSISGKPLPKLVGFIEKELNMKIDPNSESFQGVDFSLPDGKLTAEDTVRILTAIDDDTSRLSTVAEDRARHGTGHTQDDIYSLRSGSFRTRLPDVVVWPRSVSEVQALASLATTYNWCIIPFGGGTNVTHSTHCPSSTVDPRLMVSVDMKLMKNVLWVNEEDGLAHVEAGITGRDLIERMRRLGFTIGHEPDSYEFSTLGGWIATKASGMKQNKYGNIEDIVKEVTVVSAKGIMSHKHKANKVSFGRSSAGIEPKALMLGSEGCLGVITSAVIKIWPLAEEISHESVLFPSFDAGLRFVKDLSNQRTLKPASCRLLDNEQFRLGQAMTGEQSSLESFKSYLSKKMGFYLGNLSEKTVACATITFEGSAAEVRFQKKIICELSAAHGGILAGSRVSKSGYDLTFAIAYLRDFAMNYNILG